MPHVIIDYSRGAGQRVQMEVLTQAVHRCIRDGGVVEPKALRTLAREADCSCVADEHPQNQFIQIIIRLAPGRTVETKQDVVKAVFTAARAVAAPALADGRIALRVDLYESNPAFAFQESTLP